MFGSNLVILIALISIIYYYLPSTLNPVIWENPFELPSLIGPLLPNDFLTPYITTEIGKIIGPESMAINSTSGIVYTSLSDGRIVSLNHEGKFLRNIYFDGILLPNPSEKLSWCQFESLKHTLAWNVSGEKYCGRPLGIRISESKLYFIDAYHGLFVIEFDQEGPFLLKNLNNPNTPILSFSETTGPIDYISFKPPAFYNDLTIQTGGNWIFFTDSSYLYHRSQNRQELLDGAPRGRLLGYNLNSSLTHVFACNLHFPNGIQMHISNNSQHLLVVEGARFRILRFDLNSLLSPDNPNNSLISNCSSEQGSMWSYASQNQGQNVFLDGAPGILDNIRSVPPISEFATPLLPSMHLSPKVRYLVGVGSKSSQPFSLIWLAYQSYWIRDFVGKFVPMKFVESLVPAYGLVLGLGEGGEIVSSWHHPKGGLSLISEAQFHPMTGDLWLGSHSNPFIAIIRNKQ